MKGTRENIVDLAEELIRTKGYNAFSYGDIAGLLDIRKAAIHYYFPSKRDLGVFVVDREIEKMTLSREECLSLPADQQLRRLIEVFYDSGEKGWICLNGSLAPDYITLPELLQIRVKAMVQLVLAWMTGCLEKGQKDKTLQFEGGASDRALLVMSALLSALLLSRVLGKEIFTRMLDQVLRDLSIKI